MKILLFITLLFCLVSCEKNEVHPLQTVYFPARELIDGARPNLYRIKIPSDWRVELPPSAVSITDTTKPNGTLIWGSDENLLKLTIYTFGFTTNKERIPPGAQVARWQGQFKDRNSITEYKHGGFVGLLFEGESIDKGEKVIAITMSLDARHIETLTHIQHKNPLLSLMLADYTLKLVGPAHLVDTMKDEILSIMNSFELIAEIPTLL